MIDITVEKINDKAIIPEKTKGDLGFDLHVICDDTFYWSSYPGQEDAYKCIVRPQHQKMFCTGLKFHIPKGFGILLRDRSGLASKHGIHVLAGVIDSSYLGEIKIAIVNLSHKTYFVQEHDRIAQGIIVPDYEIQFHQKKIDEQTSRGEKGFGSSGR